MERKKQTPDSVFKEYEKGLSFKTSVNLFDTVEVNENFFIGKQWEGVVSNGLPTPVFNFLKRVILFQVASILSDNIKMQATPLAVSAKQRLVEQMARLISDEFEALFEHNNIGNLLREYMRNAAVDGDGCLYSYWDPDIKTGHPVDGAIVTEVIENTRVFFGNPNERRVQRQPYIIIESREMVDSVKERAGNMEIQADTNRRKTPGLPDDERVTVLLRMWKQKNENGETTIHACECVKGHMIREPWDMGIRLYPLTWLCWDYVQDCYHGQAVLTGLIPNQIFVNNVDAMVQLSLMQNAFPKVVYDNSRIKRWTNQVGAAVGVPGTVEGVAKIIAPAQVSPQITEFIDSTIGHTQTFLGATAAALGETRPDNTSAIVALQRASSVPSEITKQNLYQSVEDLGHIYLEFMISNYGVREVKAPPVDLNGLPQEIAMAVEAPEAIEFDFSQLKDVPMSLKLDVGAASYWSEIATMQTLDNLLLNGHIGIVDYLERIPSGYIPKRQELIENIKAAQAAIPQQQAGAAATAEQTPEIPLSSGNSNLQRAIVEGAGLQKAV